LGVNGIAFAGDYLSAASFLGICGMIATAGYDGFLYSIGYLAGWIVALFVVAEPMKRLGKYTFTDALDAKFNNKGIKLAAAVSTLIVSVCYLIPQMVGAGTLVEPLLGLPHMWGVIMVGAIVITIVATAGMASTTYVQFLKGALLIVFSTVLVVAVLSRGVDTSPDHGGAVPYYEYAVIPAADSGPVLDRGSAGGKDFVLLERGGLRLWFMAQRGPTGGSNPTRRSSTSQEASSTEEPKPREGCARWATSSATAASRIRSREASRLSNSSRASRISAPWCGPGRT